MSADPTVKPMSVATLIELLKLMPQDLPVAFEKHSEYCLLEAGHIRIIKAQAPRPDGWVHDGRPDKCTHEYLMFPG